MRNAIANIENLCNFKNVNKIREKQNLRSCENSFAVESVFERLRVLREIVALAKYDFEESIK